MEIEFNEKRRPFKTYTGTSQEQMPLLIAGARVPVSVADVIERRLNSQNFAWRFNSFRTGDMIGIHPDGRRFKVVRDAELLRELHPDTRLVEGALELGDGLYESLDGAEFNRSDALFDQDLSPEEAKAHPVWQYVARDKVLLPPYVDDMFLELKRSCDYDKGMGVILPGARKTPMAWALFAQKHYDGFRLSVSGFDKFDHLVGVDRNILEDA